MSKQNMRTPPWLFTILNRKFGPFTLDAAAEPHNALCKKFYTKEDGGLSQSWHSRTFCNPPFRHFGDWIEKGYKESLLGMGKKAVVLVGPVGCSQSWFHEYAHSGTIFVPSKRISFLLPDGTPTKNADRDTMIYVFGRVFMNTRQGFSVFPLEVHR